MDDREFLATVAPWGSGFITVHWRRIDGHRRFNGRSFRELDDALGVINGLKALPATEIYFCLSSQRANSGKRSRDNAVALRAVAVDIDVDPDNPKKYNTLAHALAALLQFCQLLEIPPPSLAVASGGGLHAYWLSDRDLTVDEWQVYANALKTAALSSTLQIDAVVTGDAARVLRVPGTSNWKYPDGPRPVRLLAKHCNGTRHDFADTFKKILADFPAYHRLIPETKIPVAEAFTHLDPHEQLAEGLVTREAPPLPFEPIKAECGWLREAHDTGGKAFDQPQWNFTTLCATFLEDGQKLAHEFGNQHPDYMPEKTDELWERKHRERKSNPRLGWPLCKTIHDNGGAPHCSACPHLVKGKSPLHLGYVAVKDTIIDQELHELGGSRPPSLRLPEGFALDQDGRLCAFFPAKIVKNKVHPARLLYLVSNRLRDPNLQFNNGRYGVNFTASTDRSGETEVFIGGTDTVKPGLFTTMLKKGIRYNTHIEATRMTERFAMSWLDKLMDEDNAVRDPGTMGWRYEHSKRTGFVYGDKLYHENGSVVPLISTSDDEFRSWYMPVGSKEVWLKAAKLITDRKRPELDCLLAIAFAAPLAVFAGTLYGAILSVWGEPGTSKSTAQQVAAAVWGHPKQTRESLTSTPKSVQGRLGRTRNLPAYWDDVQDERHQEALFQTMFVAAEGAEGGRLNPDATYKQRLEWQTLLVACSNASFVDFLVNKQKSTTAGMRRVFEIEYNRNDNDTGLINQLDAGRAFAELEHNYGKIGAEYAQILASEHTQIDQLVTDITNAFTNRVEGTNAESFWWGLCGLLLSGAILANRLGADIDLPVLQKFLVLAFQENRRLRSTSGTEAGSYDHIELALTGFLNHYAGSGNIIFLDKAFKNRYDPVKALSPPMAGRPVYIQITRDTRAIWISKRALRDYLEDKDIRVRPVLNGLRTYFYAQEAKITLGAGTVYARAQESCLEVVVPKDNEVFQQIVSAWGEAAGEASYASDRTG